VADKSLWQRIVDWGTSLLDGDEVAPTLPRHRRPERADATIARVRQVNETSCGVGVAAMFARQTHKTVKAFMFPMPKRSYGTHYKDVWNALSHFGVEHQKKIRKFKTWNDIPSHALVTIKWLGAAEQNAYHWVIFQRLAGDKFRVIDTGSHGDTLTDIDLDACRGLTYSLVTPRTREQGPLKLTDIEVATPKAKVAPAKKRAKRTAKKKTVVQKKAAAQA
jgi:hypothetical protein